MRTGLFVWCVPVDIVEPSHWVFFNGVARAGTHGLLLLLYPCCLLSVWQLAVTGHRVGAVVQHTQPQPALLWVYTAPTAGAGGVAVVCGRQCVCVCVCVIESVSTLVSGVGISVSRSACAGKQQVLRLSGGSCGESPRIHTLITD